jgi:hypothetical protein
LSRIRGKSVARSLVAAYRRWRRATEEDIMYRDHDTEASF